MPQHLDPRHQEKRAILRTIGPALVAIGVVFAVIGLGSFFSSFGTFGPPRYFWCVFVGMPLFAAGVSISKFAYMGAVSRYMANEVAPVGKDVVNYMADGTKDAVRDVATAIGEGLSSSHHSREVQVVRCHNCNESNDVTANFCKTCGTSLSKSVACSSCGELNDPDARYCDNCGRPVA